MRTLEERNEMIAILEGQKAYAPARSGFGDDNHKGIDAQIQVIREEMDNDDVYNEWETDPDADNYDEHANSAACDAVNWLEGDDDAGESLRTQWDIFKDRQG